MIDYKEVDDFSYLVMEYLDAKTLKEIGHHFKKTIPLAVFSHIFAQVAAALNFIHNPQNQQIHRDIKPQNIMILNKADNWGKISVKLMDFGLVKAPDVSQKLTMREDPLLVLPHILRLSNSWMQVWWITRLICTLWALPCMRFGQGNGCFGRIPRKSAASIWKPGHRWPQMSRPDTPPALDQLLLVPAGEKIL